MLHNGFIITGDTISTIKHENGQYIVTVYDCKDIVFEKAYNTMKTAKQIETKMINKLLHKYGKSIVK